MEITKIITNDPTIIYVGTKNSEEYYQQANNKENGWSFLGLRPETEETLRKRGRETSPEDVGLEIPTNMERYFDYGQFEKDMEDDWYDRHDVQAERESGDGETLYLGFGSAEGIKYYFNRNGITDYASYCDYFDEIGLTETEFKDLVENYV